MSEPTYWVLDTPTLRAALHCAAAGEDPNDIILDLWKARLPDTTHVKLLGPDEVA